MKLFAAFLQVAGLAAITVALWMVAPALAVGFAGVAVVGVGVIVERG